MRNGLVSTMRAIRKGNSEAREVVSESVTLNKQTADPLTAKIREKAEVKCIELVQAVSGSTVTRESV